MFKLFKTSAACVAALLADVTAGSKAGLGDGEQAFWTSFDGCEFPFTKWLPPGAAQPKALVVYAHGLSGAAADFEQIGELFSSKGIAVYAYELRGMGNDPKKKRVGDLRSQSDWAADFDTFLSFARHHHRGVPLFAYGESLGALIIMHGYPSLSEVNRAALRGLVYSSPVVSMQGELPPVKDFFVRLAMKLLPRLKISLKALSGGGEVEVGEGEDHWAQMEQTPHFVSRMSLRLLGTIESMVKGSAAAAAPIQKPVLVLYPGLDVFTPAADVERFFDGIEARDKSKRRFDESHHLLMYDKEREQVFGTSLDWIRERS